MTEAEIRDAIFEKAVLEGRNLVLERTECIIKGLWEDLTREKGLPGKFVKSLILSNVRLLLEGLER